MFLHTQTIDAISIFPGPGLLMGHLTILSNGVKLIVDLAKIAFNGIASRHYQESAKYKSFKAIDLNWEKTVHPTFKPLLEPSIVSFRDPAHIELLLNTKSNKKNAWVQAFRHLSIADKRMVQYEQSKTNALRHLAFMGRGCIRTVPFVGGIALTIINQLKGEI